MNIAMWYHHDIMIPTENIQAIADRIADCFQPEKIILFGSYAYGTPTQDSDIDLLVIMPVDGDIWWQAAKIGAVAHENNPYAIDILLKTPDKAEQAYRERHPILRSAIEKGRVLYDRHSQAVA